MDRLSLLACSLFGAIRLWELRVSSSNERAAGSTTQRGAARSTFPLMVAANALLFILPLLDGDPARARRKMGGLLLLGALGLRWWCIHSLGVQWNVRAALPEQFRVVESGPYRYVRHPNYLAVMIEFAALPLFCGALRSMVALSALNGLLLWRRVRAEEQALESIAAYRQRMARKSRFLPGLI